MFHASNPFGTEAGKVSCSGRVILFAKSTLFRKPMFKINFYYRKKKKGKSWREKWREGEEGNRADEWKISNSREVYEKKDNESKEGRDASIQHQFNLSLWASPIKMLQAIPAIHAIPNQCCKKGQCRRGLGFLLIISLLSFPSHHPLLIQLPSLYKQVHFID